MKKVSVKLTEKDWSDLVQFIRGDLANMDQADEVTIQMDAICVEIIKAVAIHSTKPKAGK